MQSVGRIRQVMAYLLHELESLIAKRVDLRRTYSLPVTPWHPIEFPDAAPQGNALGGFLQSLTLHRKRYRHDCLDFRATQHKEQ